MQGPFSTIFFMYLSTNASLSVSFISLGQAHGLVLALREYGMVVIPSSMLHAQSHSYPHTVNYNSEI